MSTELEQAQQFVDQVREAMERVPRGAPAAGLLADIGEALRRYDEGHRCPRYKMARCALPAGHQGQRCDYRVEEHTVLTRECPGPGGYMPASCSDDLPCPHAGKWGATGVMPPGHIWQWRNAAHTSGYLAHIPDPELQERLGKGEGGGWEVTLASR